MESNNIYKCEIFMVIYIGIVGSRKRSEKPQIREILKHFLLFANDTDREICVVSGGAEGIDTDAVFVAKELGIPIIEFKPNRAEYSIKGNKIYFERNKLIAEKSNLLFAFPLNRKGGTMNTVRYFTAIHGKDTKKLRIID